MSAGPALPDILSAGRYSEGQWVTDYNSIKGPNVPSNGWQPGSSPFSGQPPTSSTGLDLKSLDFIQRTFLCAPYHDESNQLIMPEMLCWTVNYVDPDIGAQQVMTLSKVNQTCHDEWDLFMKTIAPGSYDHNPQNKIFHDYLINFGEQGLRNYDIALKEGRAESYDKELKEFHRMALSDDFHWLTLFGLFHHISWAGSVINTNRAVGLETMDMTQHTDHYTDVNVCVAKRARVANVFGPSKRIKTGSKLWVSVRRKLRPDGKYGELVLEPGGSNYNDYPSASELEFNDLNGDTIRGHAWRVGVVLREADSSPAAISIQQAANLGLYCNERRAYEAHGTLPSLYVALGFKQ